MLNSFKLCPPYLLKSTVYSYSGVALYIDPATNIKKVEKTHSDEKPKELSEPKKRKPNKVENLSGITTKVA